jgi:hypothetical protein
MTEITLLRRKATTNKLGCNGGLFQDLTLMQHDFSRRTNYVMVQWWNELRDGTAVE